MSISSEIVALERRIDDLEQAAEVARNEQTGRVPEIRAEIATVAERIAYLRPFAEPVVAPGGRMPPCDGCGKPFWPESLTDGRCEKCAKKK